MRNDDVGAKTSDRNKKKRDKLVRDAFSMPAREFALIGQLKKRCLSFGVKVKKSELLRMGLAAINQLTDERLAEAVEAVVTLRPDTRHGKKTRKAVVEAVVSARPGPRREKTRADA
jgi:hypothetical protein